MRRTHEGDASSRARSVAVTAVALAAVLSGGCARLDGGDTATVPTTRHPSATQAAPSSGGSSGAVERLVADAQALVGRWLEVQNEGDFAGYQGLYAPHFRGVRRSGAQTVDFDRSGWIKDRARMFHKKVTVTATDLSIVPTGAEASVMFTQTWRSGSYQDVGPKRMRLVREKGRLLIVGEEMFSSSVAPSATQIARELTARCPVRGGDLPNMMMNSERWRSATCKQRVANLEVERAQAAMAQRDSARGAAIHGEQLAWTRHREKLCGIDVDYFWTDLETGHVSGGSMLSPAVKCVETAAVQRSLYARLLAGEHAELMLHDVQARLAKGERNKRELRRIQLKAAHHARRPRAAAGVMSRTYWQNLRQRAAAVEQSANEMAQVTCGQWSGLAAAAGGTKACVERLERYYLSSAVLEYVGAKS